MILIGRSPPQDFKSDGCTAAPRFVPATSGGLVDIHKACVRHDYEYSRGGTELDRRVADANLMVNMVILGADALYAVTYYRGVRVFGVFSRKRGYQYNPRVLWPKRLWYCVKALFWM